MTVANIPECKFRVEQYCRRRAAPAARRARRGASGSAGREGSSPPDRRSRVPHGYHDTLCRVLRGGKCNFTPSSALRGGGVRHRHPSDTGGEAVTREGQLAGLKAHDPATWNEVAGRCRPRLVHWAAGFGLQCSDAEDVVQEALMAMFEHIDAFAACHDGGSGLSFAWLRSVVRNKVLDHFRRRQAEPDASGGSRAQCLLAQLPDPVQIADSPVGDSRQASGSCQREAIRRGRAHVKQKTWRAFCRFAVDGLSIHEVAAELGMTENAVYKATVRVIDRIVQERIGLGG